jgi:hypothetical protein
VNVTTTFADPEEVEMFLSTPIDGITALQACCACGGGGSVDILSNTLIEWKLDFYGYQRGGGGDGGGVIIGDVDVEETTSPSSEDVPAPSQVPSVADSVIIGAVEVEETTSPSSEDVPAPSPDPTVAHSVDCMTICKFCSTLALCNKMLHLT